MLGVARCVSVLYKYWGRGIGFLSVFKEDGKEYVRIFLGEQDIWNAIEFNVTELSTEKVLGLYVRNG